MSEVARILNAAADLLEQPGAWTQGAFAKDKNGFATYPLWPEACCFCVLGALERIAGGDTGYAYGVAEDAVRDLIPSGFVSTWNDAPERTQAEVVTTLRAAAKHAEGGAA